MADKEKMKAAVELGLLDHGILGRESARRIVSQMGLDDRDIPFYVIEHRPDQIKGANLAGCTKIGEKKLGVGADDLAVWCCKKLNLSFARKFGRGSQLRVCAEALVEHFSHAGDPTEASE